MTSQPKAFNQVIGNTAAIERIKSAIAENNGLGGCIFFLQGETGNGKTMLADIIANLAVDADVYDEKRIDCNDDEKIAHLFETIKSLALTPSLTGTLSIFIFNEADRLSVENVSRFKTVVDVIKKVQGAGKVPPVCIIFTTAKTKDTVNPNFQKHWDEFVTRCVFCKVGVTKDELNAHFAKVTGGAIENIAYKIKVQSVRAAWAYVKENNLPILDVMPVPESFVLPKSDGKRVKYVTCNQQKTYRTAPKKQQNLVGIIADIVRAAGSAISYATIREELDESGRYTFKRGVDGYLRTRQITSAVHNHIRKYGDGALLCKTADGRVAVR